MDTYPKFRQGLRDINRPGCTRHIGHEGGTGQYAFTMRFLNCPIDTVTQSEIIGIDDY
jgi:hypothetical protein